MCELSKEELEELEEEALHTGPCAACTLVPKRKRLPRSCTDLVPEPYRVKGLGCQLFVSFLKAYFAKKERI